ncbi:hypothetical protein FNYG_15923 [Fusarium nygamai]|uniref:DDE-1 domain-containing protein n=1 Tax=Gibberella nygamai TaxID=42673 RepID=A0A2K0U003_GIBNY|nr:hypothetical protein FNYG_15923 [Fusarium nygamai]
MLVILNLGYGLGVFLVETSLLLHSVWILPVPGISRSTNKPRKAVVHWYFDIWDGQYGWIKPENTVNVDEGGIMTGFGKYSPLLLVNACILTD